MYFNLKDEIEFWSHQLEEHCEFIELGIINREFKNRGKTLKERWNDWRRDDTRDEVELLELVQDTRNLKQECLDLLKEGEWLGWLYPAFFEHTLFELEYFYSKLKGAKYDKLEEAAFWSRVVSEHAGMSAHLLDLSEQDLITAMYNIFKDLEKPTLTIDHVRANIDEILKLHKEARIIKPLSVIHPKLLRHDIREEERAKEYLN